DEATKVWDIIESFYKSVGFEELKIRLSLRDPNTPEKYKGSEEVWKKSENQLREIIQKKGAEYFEAEGEAAFYGPKIDFISRDSLSREWQVATIQADRSMPESFDLNCINEKGEKERVIMIHAAIMGSIERFLSIFIEHTNGNFPFWISPVQAKIIPIAEAHFEFAQKIKEQLADFRIEIDDSKDSFGKKVRNAKTEKVPYFIIIGDKDMEANKVTLESRDEGQIGQLSIEELIERFKKEN
ncbi:threonine--tRNA ligase, partial [Candidatus Nomurabacteria bacterium]|nr:threonine--tRNA ligase [Candidatus Nomurabacteria bacterium]